MELRLSSLPVLALLALLAIGEARAAERPGYELRLQEIQDRHKALAKTWSKRLPDAVQAEGIATELTHSFGLLAKYWVGTNWGRGIPQSDTPQVGKVNCGTFVGNLLRDIGFVVDIKKLQRQPSQGIIRSFVGASRTRKFSGRSMKQFLASVKAMGPGVFIIGLDLHVGILIQTEDQLRYMHSSSETGKVVIEPAAEAWTITSSGYRVVGKILSKRNIHHWLRGKRIKVKGRF